MASITYHVVVVFDRDEQGVLTPGEPKEAPSAEMAKRRAAALSRVHTGVLAFSRAGDPATGEFEDAVILSQAGEVDLYALSV